MKVCLDRHCSRAGERLRASDFPRNRNRRDGQHPYCKECAARRVRESRARISEMKKAQKRFGVKRKPMKLAKRDPLCDVYSAIEQGCRTRDQIRELTGLHFDVIGEMLALLIWEYRAVRIVDRELYTVEQLEAEKPCTQSIPLIEYLGKFGPVVRGVKVA